MVVYFFRKFRFEFDNGFVVWICVVWIYVVGIYGLNYEVLKEEIIVREMCKIYRLCFV